MTKVKGNYFRLSVIVIACLITSACQHPANWDKMMEVNKKVSKIPGVLNSGIIIHTPFTGNKGNKGMQSYSVEAQVAEMPEGRLENEKVVRDIVDTIFAYEPHIDKYTSVCVRLVTHKTYAFIFHFNKNVAVCHSPNEWRQKLNIVSSDSSSSH